MNVGAFAVIAQVSGYGERLRSIEDFTGLAAKRPVLTALLAFFLLSLIGIPFTGGFFGKFYVFSAALRAATSGSPSSACSTPASPASTTCACSPALYARPAQVPAHAVATPIHSANVPDAQPLRERAIYTPTSTRVPVPAAIGLGLAALATLILGILPGRALALAQSASLLRQPAPCTAELTADCADQKRLATR